MTDEQQETIVNEALRKFCHYLNLWWNSEKFNKDEPNPYKPECFTTYDPPNSLWGHCEWKVLEDIEGEGDDKPAFQEGLIKLEVSDGDEGGGSSLYVGLELVNVGRPGPKTPDGITISWVVHVFDTMPAMIYTEEEGFRTPPEGEMKK